MHRELYIELSKAAHPVCREIVEKFTHERIYSFNFYTHPELTYVGDNFSTEVGFDKVMKEYIRRGDRFSLAQIRWSPPDSPYHAMFSDRFASADKLLNDHWRGWQRMTEQEWDRKYTAVRDTLVEVLIDLRNARIFDRAVVLNFVCGDQSFEERLVSAEHINHPDILQEYQKGCKLDWDCVNRLRQAWFNVTA